MDGPAPGDLVQFENAATDGPEWGRVVSANGRLLVEFGQERTFIELAPEQLLEWRSPGKAETDEDLAVRERHRRAFDRAMYDEAALRLRFFDNNYARRRREDGRE